MRPPGRTFYEVARRIQAADNPKVPLACIFCLDVINFLHSFLSEIHSQTDQVDYQNKVKMMQVKKLLTDRGILFGVEVPVDIGFASVARRDGFDSHDLAVWGVDARELLITNPLWTLAVLETTLAGRTERLVQMAEEYFQIEEDSDLG